MTVWRIKLNSGLLDANGDFAVDWDEAKEYCRKAGLVGVGWGFSKLRHHSRFDRVLDACRETPGWSGGIPTITRLALHVQEGDLMWTRDSLGRYWLCQITGPWSYDKTADCARLDLFNIRPARWLEKSFRDYEVPGAVVRSFTGIGQTLRRIGDHPEAVRVSEMLWRCDIDPHEFAPLTPEQVMTDIVDPIDVEDLVLLYLQSQGWMLIPSSRMHDTPMYEAALRRAATGELAVVSVKSGSSNPVPIEDLATAAGRAQPYAYSTHELYSAPPAEHGVLEIQRSDLIGFMYTHPELLPSRIARWLASGA